jgi:hypothetical protein
MKRLFDTYKNEKKSRKGKGDLKTRTHTQKGCPKKNLHQASKVRAGREENHNLSTNTSFWLAEIILMRRG